MSAEDRLVGAVYLATRELHVPPDEVREWVRCHLPARDEYRYSDEERLAAVHAALEEKS